MRVSWQRGLAFVASCALGCFADPPEGGSSSEDGPATEASSSGGESSATATTTGPLTTVTGDPTSTTATASTVADSTADDTSADATATSDTTSDSGPSDGSTGEPVECAELKMCLDCAYCTLDPDGACVDELTACGGQQDCMMIANCMLMCGAGGMPTMDCYNACLSNGGSEDQTAAYELLQCTACTACVGPCDAWGEICALPPPLG